VLSSAINGLNQEYGNITAPAFSGAVGAINPANLKTAQDARKRHRLQFRRRVHATTSCLSPSIGLMPLVAPVIENDGNF
jgi:hypothetical protein